MSTRKPKTRYDYNRLKQYCDENNIVLTKDYSKEKINRDTRIEANCLNCSREVKKNFREFLNSGCFCETCTKQNAKLIRRETRLNNGSAIDYLELIKENINIYNCTDVSINGKPISEYRSTDINGKLNINFTCNCGEKQNKSILSFVELMSNTDADGGKCRTCIRKETILKRKETRLKTGLDRDFLKLIKEIINTYNCTDVSIHGKPISECLNNEIHREVNIEFTCNCGEKQSKSILAFVELVNGDADGGKCEKCMLKERRLKTRETLLNNGSAIDYLKLIKEIIDIYNCTDVSIDGKPISEYQSKEIHRHLYIDFTCSCGEKERSKSLVAFAELISSDTHGGKCRTCVQKEKILKQKKTFLNNYGVEWCTQSQIVKDKITATNMERHGCKYAMQNAELFDKQQKSAFKRKEYIFPSGRIDSVQGYEPQALDYFITNGGNEDDIITDTNEIESKCGNIFYHFEDERHRYYPDFYQISTHKIIEVKSIWTFEIQKEKNLKKREACINAGINFEFWIMEENGNLLKII